MNQQYSFLFSGRVVRDSTAYQYLLELTSANSPWNVVLSKGNDFAYFEISGSSANDQFVVDFKNYLSLVFESHIHGDEAAEFIHETSEYDSMAQEFIGNQAQINFSVSKRIEEVLWEMSRKSSLAVVGKAIRSWLAIEK